MNTSKNWKEMIYLKKNFIMVFMASIILVSSLFGSAVYAEVSLPKFYNIDLMKSYYEMDNTEIEQIISEYKDGNEFAKLVNGRLVNYNDYRNKIIVVIMLALENKLSPTETTIMITAQMPSILASLPDVEVETAGGDELIVLDIY